MPQVKFDSGLPFDRQTVGLSPEALLLLFGLKAWTVEKRVLDGIVSLVEARTCIPQLAAQGFKESWVGELLSAGLLVRDGASFKLLNDVMPSRNAQHRARQKERYHRDRPIASAGSTPLRAEQRLEKPKRQRKPPGWVGKVRSDGTDLPHSDVNLRADCAQTEIASPTTPLKTSFHSEAKYRSERKTLPDTSGGGAGGGSGPSPFENLSTEKQEVPETGAPSGQMAFDTPADECTPGVLKAQQVLQSEAPSSDPAADIKPIPRANYQPSRGVIALWWQRKLHADAIAMTLDRYWREGKVDLNSQRDHDRIFQSFLKSTYDKPYMAHWQMQKDRKAMKDKPRESDYRAGGPRIRDAAYFEALDTTEEKARNARREARQRARDEEERIARENLPCFKHLRKEAV